MFGFGLFDGAIERECAMIMSAGSAVRQNYSWFLDERSQTDGRHLTNAGWSEWTAAMCGPRAVDDLYRSVFIIYIRYIRRFTYKFYIQIYRI